MRERQSQGLDFYLGMGALVLGVALSAWAGFWALLGTVVALVGAGVLEKVVRG